MRHRSVKACSPYSAANVEPRQTNFSVGHSKSNCAKIAGNLGENAY